jgi:NADP-dependent 3-hydroxy acid dehydrogenase YdfG
MRVVAVARDAGNLSKLKAELGAETRTARVEDEVASRAILEEVRPDLLVLCAGAAPVLRPIHEQTWETFQTNWQVDTKATFGWIRDALTLPLKPGSHVIVFSSGAALRGSPVSGGYAGAKRTQWFIADYAANESTRLKLGLRFHCLLPALNPNTELGRAAVAAYSAREGITAEAFVKRMGETLTPATAGRAVLELFEQPEKWDKLAYQLAPAGLAPLP